MKVVYAGQQAPESYTKSIFLAGPSPREASQLNWRVDALKHLERLGYDGIVFIPLPEDGRWPESYDSQVEWEDRYLHMADVIVFWVPRDLETLPAFTTNVEYGMWLESGKIVLGFPPSAQKMRYLAHHGAKQAVPISDTLDGTLRSALERLGDGALRSGGERDVPLYIWRTPNFQAWYKAQKAAGNRLDGARVAWTFRVGPKRSFLLFWALHANVHVAFEGRNKTNEVVLSRPDISTVVAYRRAADIGDTEVVLIREFRSPASTGDGFIHEVPGGSSWKPGQDPFATAAKELSEETGFSVSPDRLRRIGSRQVGGTLSTHKAHVFACEVTEGEIGLLKSEAGVAHGVAKDTERTYVEVHRLRDLLRSESDLIDWSNLGMLLTAILTG